jgi:hypothetical protein
MYTVSNVISLRRFRWHKRIASIKKAALDPSVILIMGVIMISAGSLKLMWSLIEKYPDAYGYLLLMP